MVRLRRSIASRLAILLVSLTSLVLAAGGAAALWALHQQSWRALVEAMAVDADQFSNALSLPLWNFQGAMVDQVLDSAMKEKPLAGILVRQPDVASPGGIRQFSRTRDAQWRVVPGVPSLAGGVLETRNITYQGKVIGSLAVVGTTRWIDADLRSRMAFFIGLVLLLDGILVACLYTLIHRDIIRPIQVLAEFSDRVIAKEGEVGGAPSQRFHGELDGLRSSIGSMVGLLQDRYTRLKTNEARFRTLIEEGPTAICVIRDQVLLYGNRKFMDLFGFQGPEDFTGRSIGILVAPEVREVVLERSRKRDQGEPAPPEYETIGRRKDGSQFPGRVVVAIVELPDGPAQLAFLSDITDQLRAQENQRFLASILEQTPDAVLVTDLGGSIIEWNPGAERLFGYTRKEALGKTGFLNEPEALQDEKGQKRGHLRDGAESFHYETSRRAKDGRLVHVSVSASLLRQRDGKPMGYAAIYRDISEQRAAQENQRLLALVMEQSPDAIVASDLEEKVIQWNQGAERMFGWTTGEALGRKLGFFVPEELAEEGARARQALLRGEKFNGVETLRMTKDGRRIPVLVSAGPLQDASGRILGASAIFRDISVEKEAQKIQHLLASILEQTPDAVKVSDLQGNILEWNEGAEKLFGYKAEEVLGRPDSFLDPDSQPGAVAKAREEILESGEVRTYEATRKAKDGRLIPVEVTSGPVRSPQGQVVGYSAICRDMTEKLSAQGNQRLLAAVLEQTPDAVVSADRDERIIQWNEGAERMFGYSAEEALGKPFDLMVPDHLKVEAAKGRKALLAGGKAMSMESTRKEGTAR